MSTPPQTPLTKWESLTDALALGEPLSIEEEAFVSTFVDSGAEREREVYRALADLGEPGEVRADDRARALATIAARTTSESPPHWRRLGIGLAAAGLAAAAVALLWTSTPEFTPSVPIDGGPTVASGTMMYDGIELGRGDTLPTGTWVTARGATCVRITQGRGCVDGGARLRLRENTIELGIGVLHFTGSGQLVVDDGILAAHDGQLDVRRSESGTHVEVVGGSVDMLGPQGAATVLGPGSVLSMGVEAEPVIEIDAEEDTEATEPPPVVESESETSTPSIARKPRASAAELLGAARRYMAEGKLGKASNTYVAVRRQYPNSGEAHAASVSLGQVELRRGRSKSALKAFSRYLERGGPLAEEAHWGKIRALHRLGRTERRDAAIKALRAASPSSVYLQRAKEL